MPTSASASTGPSLRPSPTIATNTMVAAEAVEQVLLGSSGDKTGLTVVYADRCRDPLRRRLRQVTGQAYEWRPRLRSSATVACGLRAAACRRATRTARTRPAPADMDQRMAARLGPSAAAGAIRRKRPSEVAHQGFAADCRCSPPTVPRMPRPGTARIVARASGRTPRRRRRRDGPRQGMLGMALQAGSRATALRSVPPHRSRCRPAAACRRSMCRSCRRRRIAACASVSMTPGSRTRQPRRASRPMPSVGRHRRGESDRAGTGNDQNRKPDQQCAVEGQRLRPIDDRQCRRRPGRAARRRRRHGRRCAGSGFGAKARHEPTRQICAQRVALPAPLLRMRSGPSTLMLPAITASRRFLTRAGFPR